MCSSVQCCFTASCLHCNYMHKEKVAEGTVIEREKIHGNPLRKEEGAVMTCVNEMFFDKPLLYSNH